MTVQAMIQKLQLRFNDSDITQDVLLSMINDEITEIQSEGNFGAEIGINTIAFTSGTSFKNLASLDTPLYIKQGGIMNVWYGSQNPTYRLRYIQENERQLLDYTETGTPRYYWLDGDILNIFPILAENTNIIVQSYNVIGVLTSTASEIPLPREHQMTVFYGVGRDLCQLFEDFNDKLSFYEAKFESAKTKLLSSGGTAEIYNQFNPRLVDNNPLGAYQLPIIQ
jgi:hypothetical protein